MSKVIIGIIKEPLLHFMLLGACIYAVYGLLGTPEQDSLDRTISISEERIDAFISQWQSRWNRPPTAKEMDGLITQFVNEEVLYRQAVSMGLNENDPITRRRMAQKIEFLTSDLAQIQQPAEGELEKYFEANTEAYRGPDLYTFSQVFFDPDKRDKKTLDDAAKVLKGLQAAGKPDPEKLEIGDKFMLQNFFKSMSERQISRQLGSGFTESVMKLEVEKWHGPVLSGYGVHLVYVYETVKASAPEFEKVKDKVLVQWHEEKSKKFKADFLKNLKDRYEIIIAEIPADRLVGGVGKEAVEVKEEAKK
ncbi:MAG: peptidyl-prolyl cis-trans isomerase [Verrucomicrobia bacterium]|nr:peptidyl-prolyl cis-trans isomerase [Verrucomicrobiota bacterium]